MFDIHSLVMLSVALPQFHLKPGALGVVVYIHGAGEAYEVEFITNDGQTVEVATIAANHLVKALGGGPVHWVDFPAAGLYDEERAEGLVPRVRTAT